MTEGYAQLLSDPKARARWVCRGIRIVEAGGIRGRTVEKLRDHAEGLVLKRLMKGPYAATRQPGT